MIVAVVVHVVLFACFLFLLMAVVVVKVVAQVLVVPDSPPPDVSLFFLRDSIDWAIVVCERSRLMIFIALAHTNHMNSLSKQDILACR